jgi:translation initiation factor IF-1
MPGEDAFKVEGIVVEVLSDRTYRVKLANGHHLLGFVAGRQRSKRAGFAPGEKVRVQLSSYDLSEGRILIKESEK